MADSIAQFWNVTSSEGFIVGPLQNRVDCERNFPSSEYIYLVSL